MEPEVMLLDEITSALDPELVGEVLDVVRELKRDGMTMLLATHEMALRPRDRRPGVLPAPGPHPREGPPDQIFESPHTSRAPASSSSA
jgi:polar amino acid transport system ATP-binding protein